MIELDEIRESAAQISERQRRENRKLRYRQMREELGLGVQEMATKLGMSRASWSRWESKGEIPSVPTMRLLHEMTGHDHMWLRGE